MKTGTDMGDESQLWTIFRDFDDGKKVDWDSAENSAPEAQRPLISGLKVISEVVSAHREGQPAIRRADAFSDSLDLESLPTAWGSVEIIEKIGEGAFGEVFRAREPQLDRDVALKLFHPRRLSPTQQISRVIEEGRLLARVHHPNVVTVHGAKQHDGRVGIWMEFIKGSTLEEILTDQGRLSPDEAMMIGRDVCRALAALHGAGIIHRDIKARNVMREEGGRIVLMDLGVSCETDRQVSQKPYGTPLYAAPEVLLENKSTYHSDIYSVGVLLFYMVTGEYPIHGMTLEQVCDAHEAGRVRLLRDLRPDLPEIFILIIEKALARYPDQRFTTADRFELVLIDALGESPLEYDLQKSVLPSVAVLPFEDLSQRKDQDYFCEGLAEGIIDYLSRLKSLRVIARSSSFAFKGKRANLTEIGNVLEVEAVLVGNVHKTGDQFHISSRLVNVSDRRQIWSGDHVCAMGEVFTAQSEISLAIADNLSADFFQEEKTKIFKTHTENVEAYDLTLKARYLQNMGTKSDLEKAVEYFQLAIAKDSRYVQAYVGLAECYTYMYAIEYISQNDLLEKAMISAQKAVDLAPSLAEAHSALGFIQLLDWNWTAAERSSRNAIDLDSQSSSGHYSYAHYLMAMGRLEDAIEELKSALAIDPLSRQANAWLGVAYLRAREMEKAREHVQYAHVLQSETPISHIVLGQIYILTSEYEAGLAELQKAVDLSENVTMPLAALGWGYAFSGRKAEALKVLEDLKERRETEHIRPYLLAKLYCGLGDRDRAFVWLEKAVQERDICLLWIKTDETIDDLRGDARYADILHQMRLDS